MDEMEIRKNFSSNLVKLRKLKKLNQNDLAKEFNYSNKAISKWETGETIPDIVVLKQIADFLGVKMEELTKIPKDVPNTDLIQVFMGKVETKEAQKALEIADKLSDMILFHSKVRENGVEMMEECDF